jgi:hypothetical protein
MARKVFYSFDFAQDSHRVAQVKQIGVIEGQPLLSSNEWEDVKKGGDAAIKKWIDEKMKGTSCLVVLIGTSTAGRRWVKYEIKKAWEDGRGIVGVHIHGLKNLAGEQSTKGINPFAASTLEDDDGVKLKDVAVAHDPPYTTSTYVYDDIKENLAKWVESAIELRKASKSDG